MDLWVDYFRYLAVNFYVSFNSQIEQIDLYAFEDKVKAGEVDKIEIINEKVIYVYLRKEVIDAKYPKLKDSKMYGFNPHFKFTIGDIGNFENKLQTLKTDGYAVKYTMKQETNYFGQIIKLDSSFLYY